MLSRSLASLLFHHHRAGVKSIERSLSTTLKYHIDKAPPRVRQQRVPAASLKSLATSNPPNSASSSTESEAPDTANPPTEETPPLLFDDPRKQILDAALAKVPELGWTEGSLAAGAASLGYPAVAHGMFSRGAIELVEYFVEKINTAWLEELNRQKEEMKQLPSSKARLRLGIELRLRLIAPHLFQWPQALAVSLMPHNLEATAKGLAFVADELCYVSGDRSVDLSWYAHRATVCSVYVATQLFFLTDYSDDYRDTWEFLDRRLDDLDVLSQSPRNVQEGVMAVNTAAVSVVSAISSMAQPAVWNAIQRVPISGAMMPVLQTALANLAAMAPPTTTPPSAPYPPSSPAAGPSSSSSSSAAAAAASSVDNRSANSSNKGPVFKAPPEEDPYAEGIKRKF